MKILKWIVIGGAAIVAIVVIAAYVIVSRYDFNDFKPLAEDAVYEATGRKLTLAGDIDIKLGLTPSLIIEDVSFQNAAWGSRPEAVKLKRFEVEVALMPLLSGGLEVKRFIMIEPDILVETNKAGKSNLEFAPPTETVTTEAPEGDTEMPKIGVGELRIVDGNFTYKDGVTGETQKIVIKKMTASAGSLSSQVKLALDATYQDKPISVNGSLGAIDTFTGGGGGKAKPYPIDLRIKAVGVEVAVDGLVADPLSGKGVGINFKVSAKDLAGIEELAGAPLPVKGPIELSGRIESKSLDSFNLSGFKLKFGESDLAGKLNIKLSGARPVITATLTSTKLDLRPILSSDGAAEEAATTKKTKAGDKVFPSDPLPLKELRNADATLKIKAGKLLLPSLAINDLDVKLTLKSGRLSLLQTARIGGGTTSTNISLTPNGSRANLSVNIKVAQMDLAKLLKEMEITETLEGLLDVDIKLTGNGSSVAAIMAGLNGRTRIVMGSGKIDNKYMNFLGGGLTSNVLKLVNPLAEKEKSPVTVINCMVSGFDIKSG
ncbi:MAG: AsmA family protein, partial [Thermodesulfobacteriota bacterium]